MALAAKLRQGADGPWVGVVEATTTGLPVAAEGVMAPSAVLGAPNAESHTRQETGVEPSGALAGTGVSEIRPDSGSRHRASARPRAAGGPPAAFIAVAVAAAVFFSVRGPMAARVARSADGSSDRCRGSHRQLRCRFHDSGDGGARRGPSCHKRRAHRGSAWRAEGGCLN
jgi:hypothetical protein